MIDFSRWPADQPLRIILGAGQQRYAGWIATQKEELDLLQPASWHGRFGPRRADAFLCEHVWEHFTEAEGEAAAALCFAYLRPGGYLRCAVPDANFGNAAYQQMVQVGGPGPADHPAADHKVLYSYQRFAALFTAVGFEVDLLEYCDANGRFHYHHWSAEQGKIYRSLRFDHRNQTESGELQFVSLILDAIRPI